MAAFIYVSASDSDQVVIQRSAVSKSVNLSRLRVSVLRVAASVLNRFRNLLEHIKISEMRKWLHSTCGNRHKRRTATCMFMSGSKL